MSCRRQKKECTHFSPASCTANPTCSRYRASLPRQQVMFVDPEYHRQMLENELCAQQTLNAQLTDQLKQQTDQRQQPADQQKQPAGLSTNTACMAALQQCQLDNSKLQGNAMAEIKAWLEQSRAGSVDQIQRRTATLQEELLVLAKAIGEANTVNTLFGPSNYAGQVKGETTNRPTVKAALEELQAVQASHTTAFQALLEKTKKDQEQLTATQAALTQCQQRETLQSQKTAQCTQALGMCTAGMATCQQSLAQETQKFDALQEQLRAFKDEKSRLEQEQRTSRSTLQQAQAELVEQTALVDEMRTMMGLLKTNQSAEIAALRTTFDEDMTQLQLLHQTSEEHYRARLAQTEALQQKLTELEADMVNVKNEHQQCQLRQNSLQTEVAQQKELLQLEKENVQRHEVAQDAAEERLANQTRQCQEDMTTQKNDLTAVCVAQKGVLERQFEAETERLKVQLVVLQDKVGQCEAQIQAAEVKEQEQTEALRVCANNQGALTTNHQDDIAALEATQIALNEERNSLIAQLVALVEEHQTDLQQQKDDLTREHQTALEANLLAARDQAASTVLELQTKLQALEQDRLQPDVAALEAEKEHHEAALQAAVTEKETAEATILQLQLAMTQLEYNLTLNVTNADELSNQLAALRAQLQEAELAKNQAEALVATLQEQVAEQKTQIETLQAENDEALFALQGQIESAKSQWQHINNEATQFAVNTEQMQAEYEQREAQLQKEQHAFELERDSLETVWQPLKAQNEVLQARLEKVLQQQQETNDELEIKRTEFLRNMDELETEKGALQQTLRQTARAKEALQGQLDELTVLKTQNMNRIQELENELKKSKALFTSNAAKIMTLETTLTETTQAKQRTEAEVRLLKEKERVANQTKDADTLLVLAEHEEALRELKTVNSNLLDTNTGLVRQKNAADEQFKELRKDLEDAKEELVAQRKRTQDEKAQIIAALTVKEADLERLTADQTALAATVLAMQQAEVMRLQEEQQRQQEEKERREREEAEHQQRATEEKERREREEAERKEKENQEKERREREEAERQQRDEQDRAKRARDEAAQQQRDEEERQRNDAAVQQKQKQQQEEEAARQKEEQEHNRKADEEKAARNALVLEALQKNMAELKKRFFFVMARMRMWNANDYKASICQNSTAGDDTNLGLGVLQKKKNELFPGDTTLYEIRGDEMAEYQGNVPVQYSKVHRNFQAPIFQECLNFDKVKGIAESEIRNKKFTFVQNDRYQSSTEEANALFLQKTQLVTERYFHPTEPQNVCYIAYGASGSGKTYSTQQLVEQIIETIYSSSTESNYAVYMFSDYLNELFDYFQDVAFTRIENTAKILKSKLQEQRASSFTTKLKTSNLLENLKSKTLVELQTEAKKVNLTGSTAAKQIWNFIDFHAKAIRRTGNTGLNTESSRSHMCFVFVDLKRKVPAGAKFEDISRFVVADFAGTENLEFLVPATMRPPTEKRKNWLYAYLSGNTTAEDDAAKKGSNGKGELDSDYLPRNEKEKLAIFANAQKIAYIAEFLEAAKKKQGDVTEETKEMTDVRTKFDLISTEKLNNLRTLQHESHHITYSLKSFQLYLQKMQRLGKKLEALKPGETLPESEIAEATNCTGYNIEYLNRQPVGVSETKPNYYRQTVDTVPCLLVEKILCPLLGIKSAIMVLGTFSPRASDDLNSWETANFIVGSCHCDDKKC